jgi:hypothetical protein
MFCRKCGNKLVEIAEFCNICGTNVIKVVDDTEQSFDVFEEFMDNHIRSTTKFKSVEAFLVNSSPFKLMWLCFGIITVICTIAIFPMGFILGFIITIPVVLIAVPFMAARLIIKSQRIIEREVDIEDLIQFLNSNLQCLFPYFSEWGYMEKGFIKKEVHENVVCCHSDKKSQIIAIHLTHTSDNKKKYFIKPHIKSGASGFFSYITGKLVLDEYYCIYKSAPVLNAAMEYYLNKSK